MSLYWILLTQNCLCSQTAVIGSQCHCPDSKNVLITNVPISRSYCTVPLCLVIQELLRQDRLTEHTLPKVQVSFWHNKALLCSKPLGVCQGSTHSRHMNCNSNICHCWWCKMQQNQAKLHSLSQGHLTSTEAVSQSHQIKHQSQRLVPLHNCSTRNHLQKIYL